MLPELQPEHEFLREDKEKAWNEINAITLERLNEDYEDGIIITNEPFETLQTKTVVATHTKNNSDIATAKAKKFLDHIEMGFTPNEAAAKAEHHSSPRTFLGNADYRDAVAKLIRTRHLPEEVRKLLVKNGLNEIAMANIGVNDKIALDALKQIAADPEVGLDRSTSIGVTINIGELDDLMKRVDLPKEFRSEEDAE